MNLSLKDCITKKKEEPIESGPDYPIGAIGTVPRAYEKMIIKIIQYLDVIKYIEVTSL